MSVRLPLRAPELLRLIVRVHRIVDLPEVRGVALGSRHLTARLVGFRGAEPVQIHGGEGMHGANVWRRKIRSASSLYHARRPARAGEPCSQSSLIHMTERCFVPEKSKPVIPLVRPAAWFDIGLWAAKVWKTRYSTRVEFCSCSTNSP